MLTQRYVTTLVLIALLVVLSLLALVQANQNEVQDRAALAAASRVQVLVNHVGVLGSELVLTDDARDRGRLRQQLRRQTLRLESTWRELVALDDLSPAVQRVLFNPPVPLDGLVESVVISGNAVADVPFARVGPHAPEVQALREEVTRDATTELLAALVGHLEHERAQRNSSLLALQQGLSAVVLVILLLSAVFVFRPMTQRIEREVSGLARLNASLEGLVAERTQAVEDRAATLARSQEALRAQTEVLQSVLDHMEDGVVVVDGYGDVMLHNPAAMRIGGTNIEGTAKDLWTGGLGLFQADGTSPARWEELPLNRALHGEEHSEGEFLLRDAGELGTWIHALARPLTSVGGVMGGAVMVFRDMTSRHRAEQDLRDLADELARSNHDLEQFAYIASHDLQEPLRVVKSYVQLLERRYGDRLDADATEFMGFIVEATTRMSHLIRDLLAYSRAGPRRRKPADFPLEEAVRGALINLRAAAAESGAHVDHVGLPRVHGDKAQITQLFQNLLGNAMKFQGDEAPSIQVTAVPCELGWRVAVADNGIGISPEYQERIFAIFQRLHPRGKYPGTGIGLSICKRIVESHGGVMGVDSDDGQGSTFWFELPGVEPPAG